MKSLVVKKFYRDFSEEEQKYLDDLLDETIESPIDFPPHVLSRMVERGLVPSAALESDAVTAYQGCRDAIATLEEGMVYEISNEGIGKTINPFRIVVACEFRNSDDNYTMFVKISPQAKVEKVKVLDVWRRKGFVPIYPPQHALDRFVADWDVIDSLEVMFQKQLVPHPANDDSESEELIRGEDRILIDANENRS